ncbi:MAG: hypothetical protein AAGF11_33200 [Myxococcota bacterium]
MIRPSAIIVLLCATACSETETTPLILDASRGQGACGSVVEGTTPDQVECPVECPIAVRAYRVANPAACTRSAARYVACISAGEGGGDGQPGAAVLDTEDGPLFIDDPALDCSGDDGCASVNTITTSRWETCAEAEAPGCECVCTDGACSYERFVEEINGCNLPTPCEPLTGGEEPTIEQLQCYMDQMAGNDPLKIEIDGPLTNDQTGEQGVGRTILAVGGRSAVRLQELSFDGPASVCDLQDKTFFLSCDPEDPYDVNVDNEDGLVERIPCTDPRGWIANCRLGEPVCPG